MRKLYKKITSQIIVFVMVVALILTNTSLAEAITVSEMNTVFNNLKNSYPTGTIWRDNYQNIAFECHGFALLVCDALFGENANNWGMVYDVNNLYIGDLVRYRSTAAYDHSIVVTNISADTISYVDCNGTASNGTYVYNRIDWTKTITRANLQVLLNKTLTDGRSGFIRHKSGNNITSLVPDTPAPANIIYPGLAGFTTGGSYWWTGSGYGINGTMKYTYCNGNTRDSWGRWTFGLAAIGGDGYYKVEAYIPNNYATTGNAHYHISHAGKTDYKSVNQNNISNAWVDLGTYDFTSSGTAAVELDDATGETYVNTGSPKIGFDAIRLTYVSAIDTVPPTGSWIAPTNSQKVVTPGSINLSVNATDNKSIAKVVFHANYDGQWHELGTDAHGGNGTYSFTWSYNSTPQDVLIHAHLYDTSGNWTNILGPTVTFTKPLEVAITATDSNASESGIDEGIFTITRTGGSTATDLTVKYSLSGTAVNGADYNTLSGSLVIPAGSETAQILVTPVDDTTIETSETVTATLTADSTHYDIGTPASATVTITDNDKNTITIAASDATATEAGLTTGIFTLTRTGLLTSARIVNYTLSGTTINGTDYNTLSGSVTFAAGASITTITIIPKDDTLKENSETVIATLADNSAYIVGTAKSATVTIADNDKNTVTITASDASATEAGPTTGKYTVTRTGSLASALTVKYTLSGTATNGVDYNSLSGSVIIPTGATSATITVSPKDDTAQEASETVIATISTNSVYNTGTAKSAKVTISDNDTIVTIKANDTAATEEGTTTGQYTITRNGSNVESLVVKYTISGTATNGTDYTILSGSVVIPAGAVTAKITVTPMNDTAKENNETVILTLASNSAYTLGTTKSATLTIYDNDKTQVTITPSDAIAGEAGTDTGKFTITRKYGSTSTALTVNYTVSGTATNGTDYAKLSGSVVIPVGSTIATITVTPKNDTTKEGYETVIIKLGSNSAYNIGPLGSATMTIADND